MAPPASIRTSGRTAKPRSSAPARATRRDPIHSPPSTPRSGQRSGPAQVHPTESPRPGWSSPEISPPRSARRIVPVELVKVPPRSAPRPAPVQTTPSLRSVPRPASVEPLPRTAPVQTTPIRPNPDHRVQHDDQISSSRAGLPPATSIRNPYPTMSTPGQPRQVLERSIESDSLSRSESYEPASSMTQKRTFQSSQTQKNHKKRKTITQFEKIQICQRATNPHLSHRMIAEIFGIERTAVTKIVKESDYWLSLRGEDLSVEGMNRIRRTGEEYRRCRGLTQQTYPAMQPVPVDWPGFVRQRCDHQVQISRLRDVVDTLQGHHDGTEDVIERIERVIDSMVDCY